jgi:hypothetical protein
MRASTDNLACNSMYTALSLVPCVCDRALHQALSSTCTTKVAEH